MRASERPDAGRGRRGSAAVAAMAARGLQPGTAVKHFTPSTDPAEGLGVLMLFRLIEESVPDFFQPDRRILITRAPGRLDVLGGLARDAGAPAVQIPVAEAACAAIQQRDDDLVRLWAPCRDDSRSQLLSMRLGDLGLPGAPIDDDEARALLTPDPRDRWAAYLLGSLLVLARDHGLRPERGVELLVHSDVPQRCGVASSTAVAVAALRAFALAYGLDLPPAALVDAVAAVEGGILRAPHRRRDTLAVAHAHAGELLAVDGKGVSARLAVPSDLEIVALDSGVPSATTDADADEAVDVARLQQLLAADPTPAHRRELGDLLFAAHESYRQAGRVEPATDFVVAAAKARRDAGGAVLGAKATGRGGGGAVLLLGEHGKVWYEALRIKKALHDKTGHSAHVFRWSSPGAFAFGAIELQPGGDG
jgi:L-arabinokinase